MFWNVGSSGTSTRGYRMFLTESYQDWYYAEPTSDISLSYNGGGMAITQCGLGLLNGNYYSLSVAFGSTSSSSYLHPYYTNRNPNVIGITDSASSYRNDIAYSSISNGVERIQLPDTSFAETFTVIFKANRNGTCLTITYSANSSINYTDYKYFRGFKLVDMGSKAPTTTEITNALQSNFNQLNTAINGLSSTITNAQTSINNSIDSAKNQAHADSQAVQGKIDDINDSLTDDSINENGVSDFTNGLNQEYSSLTPFSDFLNLPLTWIQSLFASGQNCSAIQLPLPYLDNKKLDLPCMTEFWQRMGAIGTLIQVVWIAIVGVRIFNGLFLLTCETIDPNPDRDMTKLRTWEL